MALCIFILELIGTVSFAISGAMVALDRKMDIFGVAILGLVTATGGGVLRDILLGDFPPMMFQNPVYAFAAILVSVIVFVPVVCRWLTQNKKLYEQIMFVTDTIGLGIFTIVGTQAAFLDGYNNLFLAVFVGTITGVGGGVLRDVLSKHTPVIFIKHVYALAAIIGSLVCGLLYGPAGRWVSMFVGLTLIVLIRCLAARFRWSLPKSQGLEEL